MYLLDANAFIEASRLYYAADIAPGFWSWLAGPALHGSVGSIQAIRDELTAGTGELVTWASERPATFWLADSAEAAAAMVAVSVWATDVDRRYRQEAIDDFLDSADFKLTAHAMAIGATLVTREQPAPDSRRVIKIPDVCNAFGVAWTDPFSAYRALGMRLAG